MGLLTKVYTTDNIKPERGLFRTTLIAGNGIFELKKSWLGEATKKVSDYEPGDLPELSETLAIAPYNGPKVPIQAIQTVLDFYGLVNTMNGQEAQVNFYNTKGKKKTIKVDGEVKSLEDIKGITFWSDEIFSYTPIQRNSKALTDCDDDTIYHALNNKFDFFIETHSHNSMAAFASGTDLANSKHDGIQLVFGQFNKQNCQVHNWVTIGEMTKEKIDWETIQQFIELPELVEQNGQHFIQYDHWKTDETTDSILLEWLDNCTFQTHYMAKSYRPTRYNFKDYDWERPKRFSVSKSNYSTKELNLHLERLMSYGYDQDMAEELCDILTDYRNKELGDFKLLNKLTELIIQQIIAEEGPAFDMFLAYD